MAEWYCTVGGQQYGPLPEGQVQAWAAEGRIAPTDLVWCEGMAQWQPAGEVGPLAGLFPAPPRAFQAPQSRPSGATPAIVVACVLGALLLAGGIAAVVLLSARKPTPSGQGSIRCRNNLNQLAKGMATYLNECGDNRFYAWPAGRPGCGTVEDPNFGGAEWLASLYWTRIIPDPHVFTCPSTGDNNRAGAALGQDGTPGGARLAKDAVSYAGFGHRSVGIYLVTKQKKDAAYAESRLAIRDDFPPDQPMASDDTDDPINHGERDNGGLSVLFFDSHVEYWTHTRVDLERGVGVGDLCVLRN